MERFYTAESVTEGHPDKLCDQIADSVLDDCLAHDPLTTPDRTSLNARIRCSQGYRGWAISLISYF